MKYFLLAQDIPARRKDPTSIPEVFIQGNWVQRNAPKRWGETADEATEEELMEVLVARFGKDKAEEAMSK